MLVLSDSMIWWVQAVLFSLYSALKNGLLCACLFWCYIVLRLRKSQSSLGAEGLPLRPQSFDGTVKRFILCAVVVFADGFMDKLQAFGFVPRVNIGADWPQFIWIWYTSGVVLYIAVLPFVVSMVRRAYFTNRKEKRAKSTSVTSSRGCGAQR